MSAPGAWLGPPPGLCGMCTMARIVASGRGSMFLLCERSRVEARYPRYPRLPVLACPGFDPLRAADTTADPDETTADHADPAPPLTE